MRLLILSLLGVLLLTGCTAVELLENHTDSPYEAGLSYEKGYESPYSPAYSVKQDIFKAYRYYLIADKLGDIRAKEKIISLSSKIPSSTRKEIEDDVSKKSKYSLKDFYRIPHQYDRNRQPR